MSETLKKPRLWGHCKAGCEWETIHRSEFEAAFPYVEIHKDTENGFPLKKGIKYKIVTDSMSEYDFGITIRLGKTLYTIPNPTFNQFRNYVFFKLLDVKVTKDFKTQVIYELNGEVNVYETLADGIADVTEYVVYYDRESRTVVGPHTSYFTWSDKEVVSATKRAFVDVMQRLAYNNVTAGYDEYYWLEGDEDFVKSWQYDSPNREFASFEWKDTCTVGDITYTLSESKDIQYHDNTGQSGAVCIATARAIYTSSTHYMIDTYSWQATVGDRTLVGQEDDGTTFIGYYHLTSETNVNVDNYECRVSNASRVFIVNEDVQVSIGAEVDIFAPVLTIYNYLTPSADLTTLDIRLTESQKAEILKDVEHTILKLTGVGGVKNVYFYYTGSYTGSYYYTTTIDSKTYTMTIANNSVGQIVATISEVSGGTGGGVSEERVQEMINNSIGNALEEDY